MEHWRLALGIGIGNCQMVNVQCSMHMMAGERESERAGERERGRAGERESGRAEERESGRAGERESSN